MNSTSCQIICIRINQRSNHQHRYYQAYIKFFAEEVLKEGIAPAVEKYVFDISANWVDGVETAKQPQMLNRLLSGVLHPYIHVGYGLEFNAPGMVVEGIRILPHISVTLTWYHK